MRVRVRGSSVHGCAQACIRSAIPHSPHTPHHVTSRRGTAPKPHHVTLPDTKPPHLTSQYSVSHLHAYGVLAEAEPRTFRFSLFSLCVLYFLLHCSSYYFVLHSLYFLYFLCLLYISFYVFFRGRAARCFA